MSDLRQVDRVIAHFGGKYKLANTLEVSSSAVSIWIREGRFPAMRAIQIETISKGKFKARDLVGD